MLKTIINNKYITNHYQNIINYIFNLLKYKKNLRETVFKINIKIYDKFYHQNNNNYNLSIKYLNKYKIKFLIQILKMADYLSYKMMRNLINLAHLLLIIFQIQIRIYKNHN
jgi:hypothetical protein